MINLVLKKLRKEFQQYLKNFSLPDGVETPLLQAAESNSYIETVSNKADCLHYHVAKNYPETLTLENSRHLKKRIKRLHLGAVKVIADISEDDFYGEVDSLFIHPWTGQEGVEGKYRYLVAGILFRNRILPIYVAILHHGAFKARYLGKIADLCMSLGLHVKTFLLDRGFYSGEIIDELTLKGMDYLIFAPKKALYKSMLASTEKSVALEYSIPYKKSKSGHRADTFLVLVKDVLEYDWVFASSFLFRKAEKYVFLYKGRWNIETMFRVHDEARIKTKSKNQVIRLFYFMLGLFLVFIWNLYAKAEYVFKRFIIVLYQCVAREKCACGNA